MVGRTPRRCIHLVLVLVAGCATATPNTPTDASAQTGDQANAPVVDLATSPVLDGATVVDASTVVDLLMPDLTPPADMAMTVCTMALANPAAATDANLTSCGLAHNLGKCYVSNCSSGCNCTAYVRVDGLCTAGNCGAPLNGTGCSTGTYYSASPWSCGASPQTACMLRKLITWGNCQ